MSLSDERYTHIEFVVTLHCKMCGDIRSLQFQLTKGEAAQQINEYIKQHDHTKIDPWVI